MILEVIYHIGGASHLTPIPKWRNARSCIPSIPRVKWVIFHLQGMSQQLQSWHQVLEHRAMAHPQPNLLGLMQSFVSLWSIGSFWLVPSCCWSVFFDAFVLHWSDFCIDMQLKRICLLGLQGWTQDKFSGLNCSDERHLRLLSDAELCQLMVHW